MEEHTHTTIIRTTVQYWIDGNGAWMNRWECTSHDSFLFWLMMPSCLIMLTMYVFYAWQTHQALRYVRESHFVRHYTQLRNVFISCCTVHVSRSCWHGGFPGIVITLAGIWCNIYFVVKLLRSKSQVLAIQQLTSGDAAVEQVKDALQLIKSSEVDRAQKLIQQLSTVLRSNTA